MRVKLEITIPDDFYVPMSKSKLERIVFWRVADALNREFPNADLGTVAIMSIAIDGGCIDENA